MKTVAWCIAGIVAAAICATPASGSDADEAAFALAGLWAGRERIVSGECAVSIETESGDGPSRVVQAFEIAFDFANDMIRSERGATVDSPAAIMIRCAGDEIVWTRGEASVFRQAVPPLDKSTAKFSPLDVRTVGLLTYGNLEVRTPLSFVEEYFTTNAATRVVKSGGTVWEIEFQYEEAPGQPYRTTYVLTLDEAKDFAPVAVVQGMREHAEGMLYIQEEVSAEYEKVGDTWVPTDVQHLDRSAKQTVRHVRVTWQSVNAMLDPSVFDYRHLPLPEGALLYDTRLGGEAIVERIVVARSPTNWKPYGLIVAGLVLTICVLFVARRLLGRKTDGPNRV